MKQIWNILKLQLQNRYAFSKDWKKRLLSVGKYLLIFGVVLFVIWFLLSRISFFLGLKFNPELFSFIIFVIFVVSLISAISNIMTNMYMSKDNEILLSFPVSFNQLFTSKLILLYINELVFNFVYVAPMLIGVGIVARSMDNLGTSIAGISALAGTIAAMGAKYYLVCLLVFPIIPFATLSIGSLLSIPVMFLVKYLKGHNKTTIVFSLISLTAIFILYMYLITNVSGAFNIANDQFRANAEVNAKIKEMGGKTGLFFWFSHIFFDMKFIGRLYIFFAGFLLIFVAVFLLIRPFYQKIAVFNNETKKETKSKARKFVKRTPEKELFLNEVRTCLRSPSIIFQYFIFTLLMPLIVYTYDKLLFSIVVNQTGQALIFASHVLVLMMLTCLSSAISTVAISRQGGLLYISKMIPVKYEKQALIKIAFNVGITWVAIIISTIVSCIFSTAKDGLLIVCSIAAMLFSLGHVCQSYDTDLRKPSLNWYDVSEIDVLSKNTTTSILYGFIVSVIFTFLTVAGKGSVWLTALLLIIPAALYAFGRFKLIRVRLKYLFERMEM